MVGLSIISDLTDDAEAVKVDTNAQELTGNWRSFAVRISTSISPSPHSGVAPTQALGAAMHELGRHQGLISFPAVFPDYKILVVFPERIMKGTSDCLQYSLHDDRGAMQVKRIP